MRTINVTKEYQDLDATDPGAGVTTLQVIVDGQALQTRWTNQAALDLKTYHGLSMEQEIAWALKQQFTDQGLSPEEAIEAQRQIDQLIPQTTSE